MKVIILRGIPGSGKTTYAAKLLREDAVSVSADHFFYDKRGEYQFDFRKLPEAHQSCWSKFYEAVRKGVKTIIVDNTNTTAAEVSPYVLPAQASGYEVEIITITCDPLVAWERNIHGVPEASVMAMAERLSQSEAGFPPFWSHRKISLG